MSGKGAGAVVNNGDLVGAELVTIKARRLFAGGWSNRATGMSAAAAAPLRMERRVSSSMTFLPNNPPAH
jgi:hypothetical protein